MVTIGRTKNETDLYNNYVLKLVLRKMYGWV